MKSAAAFSTFLAMCLYVATDDMRATPSLRGLQLKNDTQIIKATETKKGLRHHRDIKGVTKQVKRIAHPIQAPQQVLVSITASSSVIVSLNIVSSSDKDALASRVESVTSNAQNFSIMAPLLTLPTRRSAPTPALISLTPSSLANETDHQPITTESEPQATDPKIIEIPVSPVLGHSGNAFEGDLGVKDDTDLRKNIDIFTREADGDISKTTSGADYQMGAPNGGYYGAGMDSSFNEIGVGSFDQRMIFGTHHDSAFNGFGHQSTMNHFESTGSHEFAGAIGRRRRSSFGGAALNNIEFHKSNNAFGNDFNRRERRRRWWQTI